MRRLKLAMFVLSTACFVLPAAFGDPAPAEAPAGFDNQPNGLVDQERFDFLREIFEERETIEDGLGPVYNAQACAECHQSPITGGASQITELRAGRFDGSRFVEHPGGSLINDRAIDAGYQEKVLPGHGVRALRSSLSILGDGFVECIDSNDLVAISRNQPWSMRGQLIQVPVLEADGALRAGRFGWKNQHASLVSFSADAYLNEMGITSPLQPDENTSMGRPVDDIDGVEDPEDEGEDIEFFAEFMRATKVPPRDVELASTPNAQAGSRLFDQLACAVCHVRTLTTAPPGTRINGGAFIVPQALGSKVIHPFGDFLLHDVGTGDGIVQNGGGSTRNKLRTAPLWGLRARNRFLHDGRALTLQEAIQAHRGEASTATSRYFSLTDGQKNQLLTFLRSL
ncbi:MAG: di-heme oxidoredictase family protein [Candidatus Polarisedimenticolia bacterium]